MKAVALFVVLATLICAPARVAAQPYPNRIIKLVVPFPAGGGADVLARIYALHERGSRAELPDPESAGGWRRHRVRTGRPRNTGWLHLGVDIGRLCGDVGDVGQPRVQA